MDDWVCKILGHEYKEARFPDPQIRLAVCKACGHHIKLGPEEAPK